MEFTQLPSLEILDLSENRFSSWPKYVEGCSVLQKLYLTANEITTLDNMKKIKGGQLAQLEELCLDMNQIEDVPAEIGLLAALSELSLADNDAIGTLPKGFERLTDLETLDIDGCSIDKQGLPSGVREMVLELAPDSGGESD